MAATSLIATVLAPLLTFIETANPAEQKIWLAYLIAFALASVLTFFETANRFYFPESETYERKLEGLVALFCALNGGLADTLLWIVRASGWDRVTTIKPILQGIIFGLGYLTVAKSKLLGITTAKGEDVPVGPEYLYNQAKDYFYRRFNRLSNRGLSDDIGVLTKAKSLTELARDTKLQIDNHQLLGDAEKVARKTWLTSVLEDAKSTEDDKKSAIAAFFLKDKN